MNRNVEVSSDGRNTLSLCCCVECVLSLYELCWVASKVGGLSSLSGALPVGAQICVVLALFARFAKVEFVWILHASALHTEMRSRVLLELVTCLALLQIGVCGFCVAAV